MLYSIFADLVVILHFFFVIFVVTGALLVLKWRWVIRIHVPVVVWAVYIEFTGRICPLTPLENELRLKSGESGYNGNFIEHYLVPILYPDGLTREIQLVLGLLVLLVNVVIYWQVFMTTHR